MFEIAICDDEQKDLGRTAQMLHEILQSERIEYILHTFATPAEMLEQTEHIDIGILDIAMNEMDGIELGRKLRERFPEVELIYITSYEQYCMQAINKTHAYSFLCKPLEKDIMAEQVMELVREMQASEDNVEKTFLKVTDSRKHEIPAVCLKLKDIVYFDYLKTRRRIAIVTNEETYEFSYVMESLVKELEGYGFAVNRRGMLVNLRHISKIKGYELYMDNGKVLALSQKRVAGFKEKMNEFIHEHV